MALLPGYRIVPTMLVWLLGLAACSGCAWNPASNRPQLVLMTQNFEHETTKPEAEKIQKTMGLRDADALDTYVDAIGERIVAGEPATDFAFEFTVLDDTSPNAFAMPGGYVFVTRGLLMLVTSEDELAAVLAHEAGHVYARHGANRASLGAPIHLVTGIGAFATGLVSPRLGQGIANFGSKTTDLLLSPHNRQQEREADKISQQILAKSGWDPAAMSTFLKKLQRLDEAADDNRTRLTFLSTHPATEERVDDTNERAADLERSKDESIVASDNDFLAKLNGLPIGTNPQQGVLLDSSFFHPDLGLQIELPTGWIQRNERDKLVSQSKYGRGFLVLSVVGEGDDPYQAIEAAEKEHETKLQTHETYINGLRALQTTVPQDATGQNTRVDVTWIAHGGLIYEIVALSPRKGGDGYRATLKRATRSFAPLSQANRRRIHVQRLRIVTAQAGETVASLVIRTRSAWSAQMVAIANGLPGDVVLEAGQTIKIARLEPYQAS
jgi:predicted Zn-dependent protease